MLFSHVTGQITGQAYSRTLRPHESLEFVLCGHKVCAYWKSPCSPLKQTAMRKLFFSSNLVWGTEREKELEGLIGETRSLNLPFPWHLVGGGEHFRGVPGCYRILAPPHPRSLVSNRQGSPFIPHSNKNEWWRLGRSWTHLGDWLMGPYVLLWDLAYIPQLGCPFKLSLLRLEFE